ncbi:MAG: DUF1456 family protein [Spirochaetales bacterium]|nr:DUF1456 family protein [Spirochaetales bacterium]
MTNNDIFRRLRYLLRFSDEQMSEVFSVEGYRVDPAAVAAYLAKEEEQDFKPLSDSDMGVFLDGLITTLRGKREPKPGAEAERRMVPRNNNDKLKKLRIAFHLEEAAMLEVFRLGEFNINKAELSAFFRKKDHRNFQPLGDQAFRRFLNGLVEYRKQHPGNPVS